MKDQNVLVTGGTSGIGKATAHRLAERGARLLLVGRRREAGEAAASEIAGASGSDAVSYLQGDLSLTSGMHETAMDVRETFDRLDVLVHAAGGVFPRELTLTDEGLELSFAVQYLARFVLTNDLLEALRASPQPQVLNIANGGASTKPVDFDNLHGEKDYSFMGAIAKNGATNDLLTHEQMTRYGDITFYNYGPGLVRTRIIAFNPVMKLFFDTLGRPFSRSPEQAADDIVTLLTGDSAGGFYGKKLKCNEPAPDVVNAAASERLWALGEELAGGAA